MTVRSGGRRARTFLATEVEKREMGKTRYNSFSRLEVESSLSMLCLGWEMVERK